MKVLHILSVISWMATLLYLPRIFVYHANPKILEETSLTFKIMEKRLYSYIGTPAAYVTWITGSFLLYHLNKNFLFQHQENHFLIQKIPYLLMNLLYPF